VSPGMTWNNDDLEEPVACPACGHPAPQLPEITGVRDFWEGVDGIWTFKSCPACVSLFLSPRPMQAAIGKAYGSYYTHIESAALHDADNGTSLGWRLANDYLNVRYGTRREPFHPAGRWVMLWLLPLRLQLDYFLRRLPRKPGRVLDIGCGNGLFLRRAIAAGWNATGMEPDVMAARAARASGARVVGDLHELEKSSFDAICASHVIEHVHDPGAMLTAALDLLRPGGVFWLATPNANSRGRRHFGRYWRGLEAPRHIAILSATSLAHRLRDAGFVDIHFHCRGRGAAFILGASRECAMREEGRWPALSVLLADLRGSFRRRAGEELVVTARRPA